MPFIKCEYCSSQFTREISVYTYFHKNEPLYVEIDIRKRGFFTFTLYIKEKITTLTDSKELNITMDGLPVDPLNAIQKLGIYLLFS
jgi:hypothetical protein